MAKKDTETPLMKQYYEVKHKHPDAILLFRVGELLSLSVQARLWPVSPTTPSIPICLDSSVLACAWQYASNSKTPKQQKLSSSEALPNS